MTTLIRYGLKEKKTGNLLGFYSKSNPEDGECCDVEYSLESRSYYGKLWLIDDKNHAEWVRNYPTEWYNAEYYSPNHNFKSEDLEVVEVNIEF